MIYRIIAKWIQKDELVNYEVSYEVEETQLILFILSTHERRQLGWFFPAILSLAVAQISSPVAYKNDASIARISKLEMRKMQQRNVLSELPKSRAV